MDEARVVVTGGGVGGTGFSSLLAERGRGGVISAERAKMTSAWAFRSASLGFAVRLDKGGDFIGREALVAAKAAGLRTRLRCLVLDDPRSVALGNEPVRVDGTVVGRVTSGGYGFAVERSIAYAYLPPGQAAIGTRGEMEIFGIWTGFEVAAEPPWDPTRARIRS